LGMSIQYVTCCRPHCTARCCADWILFVSFMDPVRFFDDLFALCGSVYHTSAAYVIFGVAIATYSCHIPLADRSVDVRVGRLTRLIQVSASLVARSFCTFHLSLGSNITPRNLCDCTDLIVVDLLVCGWEIVSVDSSYALGEKSISASLESSNGELWLSDQSNAPPGRPIMSASVSWASAKLSPAAKSAR